MVEAAFGDLVTVPGDGDTNVADLVGEYTQTPEGRYVFVHGPLVRAMREGRPLFVDDATLQVSSDYGLAVQLKIDRRAVRAARNLATRQRRGEVGWAPQLRELIAFDRIAKVLGVEAAAGNLVGVAPEEDREIVATVVRDAFGAEYAPLALGNRV